MRNIWSLFCVENMGQRNNVLHKHQSGLLLLLSIDCGDAGLAMEGEGGGWGGKEIIKFFWPFVARRRPPLARTSFFANWGPGCENGIGVVTQTIAKEKKKNERRIGEHNGPFLV